MDERIILLVNGIDPSLEGMEFGPATLKIAREHGSDLPPMKNLEYRIQYYQKTDDISEANVYDYDGNHYNAHTVERLLPCNDMYEFLYQLFAFESSERQRYLVSIDRADAIECRKNHRVDTESSKCLEETPFFTYLEWTGPQWEWTVEADYILDSMRLFKSSCVGFGIMVCTGNGLCINDLGERGTSSYIRSRLPVFTLDDTEKREYMEFYKRYREWYEKPISDDEMVRNLIALFRLSFVSRDYQSSFITQAVIWESFIKCFPELKKYNNRYLGTSERIRTLISAFLRSERGPTHLEENDVTIFKLMDYLYVQRCEYAHGSGKVDEDAFPYAVNVSECLIRKLVETNDGFDDIIKNVVSSAEKSNKYSECSAYPSHIKLMTIEPDLAEKIINTKRQCKKNEKPPMKYRPKR